MIWLLVMFLISSCAKVYLSTQERAVPALLPTSIIESDGTSTSKDQTLVREDPSCKDRIIESQGFFLISGKECADPSSLERTLVVLSQPKHSAGPAGWRHLWLARRNCRVLSRDGDVMG